MTTAANSHQQLKDFLAQQRWDEAQALWLELAMQQASEPEFLLLLLKEFTDAGRLELAAELAGLIAPNLKAAGKDHEWLYALKLQVPAKPTEKTLRTELVAAYSQVYQDDPRLKTVLAVAELDQPRTPLPAAIAKIDTLFALGTDTYCQHRSWGFGRVKAFDTTLNRLVVQFPHNPEHAMQLAYAAESLTPVSPDHIEVRKATDPDSLQQLAAADPVALVRLVLLSRNRAASADQIETDLCPAIIPADQWKKWWENAKRLLKRDAHFELPARKTAPLTLRTAPASRQDELLQAFREALSLSQKTGAARQLLKVVGEFDDPDLLLQEFHDGLLAAIPKAAPNRMADRLEAAFVLEELLAHQRTPTPTASSLPAQLLAAVADLPALLEDLGTAAQKRALAELRRAQPQRLLDNLNRLPARTLDEITDLLAPAADQLAQHVQNQTASLDLLFWLCRAVTAPTAPAWLDAVPRPALFAAVLNAIDAAPTRSATKKMRDLLLSDEALVTELLTQASPEIIRDLTRQLLACTALDELDRRSLMARLVKEFPFVQELLINRTAKEQPLIVSQASLTRRQAELDEIIQKKIPQNSKEIGVARSYGDLRENFEFKAAKDMQRLLLRRRAELELLLAKAQATNFADVKTDTVQIGTSVTVTDLESNQARTHHILGAWDSDPARNIISYPAAFAQALLNKPVGAIVEWSGEANHQRLRIDRIEKISPAILTAL